jgi:hypothetical protein
MEKRYNLLINGALHAEQKTLCEILDLVINCIGEITFNLEERCENLDIERRVNFIASNGTNDTCVSNYVVLRVN